MRADFLPAAEIRSALRTLRKLHINIPRLDEKESLKLTALAVALGIYYFLAWQSQPADVGHPNHLVHELIALLVAIAAGLVTMRWPLVCSGFLVMMFIGYPALLGVPGHGGLIAPLADLLRTISRGYFLGWLLAMILGIPARIVSHLRERFAAGKGHRDLTDRPSEHIVPGVGDLDAGEGS